MGNKQLIAENLTNKEDDVLLYEEFKQYLANKKKQAAIDPASFQWRLTKADDYFGFFLLCWIADLQTENNLKLLRCCLMEHPHCEMYVKLNVGCLLPLSPTILNPSEHSEDISGLTVDSGGGIVDEDMQFVEEDVEDGNRGKETDENAQGKDNEQDSELPPEEEEFDEDEEASKEEEEALEDMKEGTKMKRKKMRRRRKRKWILMKTEMIMTIEDFNELPETRVIIDGLTFNYVGPVSRPGSGLARTRDGHPMPTRTQGFKIYQSTKQTETEISLLKFKVHKVNKT
ncbi:hypothetical protein M9H77_09641 [Catharanthus roseus]|uniref:Uncharacterized protein n=1 Tax=Catharanthus roseus TaxID=4058 RepID=A0ACC0C178_CATRO|nr:hypothetical protein M9H77_09641 [Catharanthus roseus]